MVKLEHVASQDVPALARKMGYSMIQEVFASVSSSIIIIISSSEDSAASFKEGSCRPSGFELFQGTDVETVSDYAQSEIGYIEVVRTDHSSLCPTPAVNTTRITVADNYPEHVLPS